MEFLTDSIEDFGIWSFEKLLENWINCFWMNPRRNYLEKILVYFLKEYVNDLLEEFLFFLIPEKWEKTFKKFLNDYLRDFPKEFLKEFFREEFLGEFLKYSEDFLKRCLKKFWKSLNFRFLKEIVGVTSREIRKRCLYKILEGFS